MGEKEKEEQEGEEEEDEARRRRGLGRRVPHKRRRMSKNLLFVRSFDRSFFSSFTRKKVLSLIFKAWLVLAGNRWWC